MTPERQPIGEAVTGAIVRTEHGCLLCASPIDGLETLAEGQFTLRYGVQYLGKPDLYIVPGLIVLDYGDMLVGEEGWDFLLNRSVLHPRADVLGYRNDGVDDMVVVKKLDLVQPVCVLAYADESATEPLAAIDALVGLSGDVPPYLAQYAPHFATLADWQADQLDE